jgi:electron transfer flavoprotein beta subunit
MKIVVCVKVVTSAKHAQRLDPDTYRIVRDAGRLNEYDRHAVEGAIVVRESGQQPVEEIVVVAVAPSASLAAVQDTLAMGADRAVHVADAALAGSDLLGVSRVLAVAIAREQPDLVLFGAQGEDSGGSLLWAAVAGRLELPLLSQAVTMEFDSERVRVVRQTEAGYETISAATPCVVSLSTEANQPRYVSMKGRIAARRKKHDLVPLRDLDIEPEAVGTAGAATVVLDTAPAPARSQARVIKDGPDAARQLLEFLREKKLVP